MLFRSLSLKLYANGDFFLPISSVTNKIEEGNYRVVYYALDNEGNKAQGEFTDFITDSCVENQSEVNPNSVRTGGSNIFGVITILLGLIISSIAATIYRNKKLNNQVFLSKN